MDAADLEHTYGLAGDVIPPRRAAVLAALIRLHALEGRATVRGICALVGCSTSTCHHHLLRLRRDGLVTWESERAGTLRPAVTLSAV